ncbi:SDR family oxidoreductase [Candidatus Woesearchaeota archaeon]|nr:SDR family oxidoreductase [Candidatus Woesearchaeota archaeon]
MKATLESEVTGGHSGRIDTAFDMGNSSEPAVIMGGASGIGAACVEIFARHNHPVLIGDRNRELGMEVAKRYGNTEYRHVNVLDRGSIEAFAGFVDEWGGINHLVYTPGGPSKDELDAEKGKKRNGKPIHPIFDISEASIDYAVALNFLGYVRAIQELGPIMLNADGTRSICGITSINKLGKYGLAIYSAMKNAMGAYSIVAANKLGPKIKVNTAAPGSTITPATIAEVMDFKAVAAKTGLWRVTKPEDVARMVYELATNPAVSGLSVVVDSLQFLAEDRSRYEGIEPKNMPTKNKRWHKK